MPLKTNNTAIMTLYITEVMKKADHHAGSVKNTVLMLCGCILWAQDDNVDLEIHKIDGEMKNVLWATINNVRYAFSYNHDNATVEMRYGSIRGRVIAAWNDFNSATEIREEFELMLDDSKKKMSA